MNERKKMLPVGVEDFERLIKDHYYYADKTGLLIDLLHNPGVVNLITRPRRFGKSLNMSMLETFFSAESDKSVFAGLKISEERALCAEYMGRFPVISLSLKGVDAADYQTAYQTAVFLVREAAQKYETVLRESDRLSPSEKEDYEGLLNLDMQESFFFQSLKTLSRLLEKEYGRKVILLIDEYDVPLAKAYEQGYYDRMVFLLRNLFHQALKTNSSLQFAVLTGCMRISKESIFTGLNNLRVLSVTDALFDKYFGFTDQEVRDLLAYYDLESSYDVIKEWYDGYLFGNTRVYCPWDVISYCDKLNTCRDLPPENYWINSSSNLAVRRFIECSSNTTIRDEIERLMQGEAIEKTVKQELTYQDMYSSPDHIWSLLFTTGYLTQEERLDAARFRLVIPNREILYIFTEQIMDYFRESVQKDGELLGRFCDSLIEGNAPAAEDCLNCYLRRTISIRDTFTRKPMKESFYHGILLGILGVKDSWGVSSNQEAGDGYYDIAVRTEQNGTAILLEIKYAEDGDLEKACGKALAQIEEKQYAADLYYEGVDHVIKYGIACYRKRCRIRLADT